MKATWIKYRDNLASNLYHITARVEKIIIKVTDMQPSAIIPKGGKYLWVVSGKRNLWHLVSIQP